MELKRLRNLEELRDIIKKEKQNNKKIVFTNGCYDILHKGHFYVLEKAAKLGDILIVGLNSDNSVKRLKGEDRPKYNELDRAYVIKRIKGVDYVIIFDEDTPIELLKILQPDINVKGGASVPERVEREKQVMDEYGGEIIYIPLVEGYSTTKVINRIRNG